MKLSKTTTIAITSASAVIYGLGVFATQVSAQEAEILTSDVSEQIQTALGEGDSDELLVDALSQVESQLREYKVRSFAAADDDSREVTELKKLRLSYIQQLRKRFSGLSADEKQAFLSKIRDRRKQVRTKLVEVRKEKRAELLEKRQERIQSSKEELEARRAKFKENMETRQEAARERAKSAEEKFQKRVEAKKTRLEERESRTAAEEVLDNKRERIKRDQVKGAIDYQPETILEKIGFWLSSL